VCLVLTPLIALGSSTLLDTRHDGGHAGHGCKPKPPRNGKCWGDILGLRWTVHGFDYHASYTFTNPAHQNSWGYVNFNLTNNVVPYTAVCAASSSQLADFFYGTLDYSCSLPADAPAGASVTFRFSRPSGELDITESIICSEQKTTYGPRPPCCHLITCAWLIQRTDAHWCVTEEHSWQRARVISH
jgi:hypothetical protein